ncbi:hypothetical protein S40285_10273 [Stachybotrys chlorohalonatus IBT 40285]|uniref:Uncharacterized protein n=1 Tax=Stachybotrys chlorohalonatus (strain IBT 40285) TaxID=1283841 RepID=A0A084Q9R4_STAC4|nr:hypothetical protein S40285_10273 [Stachybotrys chlorohalonata IBT 40285]
MAILWTGKEAFFFSYQALHNNCSSSKTLLVYSASIEFDKQPPTRYEERTRAKLSSIFLKTKFEWLTEALQLPPLKQAGKTNAQIYAHVQYWKKHRDQSTLSDDGREIWYALGEYHDEAHRAKLRGLGSFEYRLAMENLRAMYILFLNKAIPQPK